MAKGNFAELAQKKKAQEEHQFKSRQQEIEDFINGADYKETNEKKRDRRTKDESEKGKTYSFYLQEEYSNDLNEILDRFSRSENLSRSDLVKIGIKILKNSSKEEIREIYRSQIK